MCGTIPHPQGACAQLLGTNTLDVRKSRHVRPRGGVNVRKSRHMRPRGGYMCANLGTKGETVRNCSAQDPQMCKIAPQILAIIQHNLRQNLCWLIRFFAFSVAWQRLRVTHMRCFGLGFRSSSTQIAIAQYVAKAKIYHESSMKPLLHRHCLCY